MTPISTRDRLVPMTLTPRQINILKHIIEEYIDTAKPVGSETLDNKYNLGVSPATLRNEMGALTENGFLKQVHTSAGRTPTPLALRYYVSNLMEPKNLSVTDEVKIKENVWDNRAQFEKTMRDATADLAQRTKSLAIASDDEGDTFYAGAANLLDMEEFFDVELMQKVLTLLDHFEYLNQIFDRAGSDVSTHVLVGDDLGFDYLNPCAVIFHRFGLQGKHRGVIGVFGPYRLNYPRLIPTVQYFGNLIDELSTNW